MLYLITGNLNRSRTLARITQVRAEQHSLATELGLRPARIGLSHHVRNPLNK